VLAGDGVDIYTCSGGVRFSEERERNGVASLPPVVFLDRSEPVEEEFSLAVLLGYCKKRQIRVFLSVFFI
jgi:hypothetical protein